VLALAVEVAVEQAVVGERVALDITT